MLRAEVVAAGTGGLDLVQRQRFVVDRHRLEQGARIAGDLVAEHEALVGALQAGLEVADVVEQRGPRELAEDRRDAELERPLLVEQLAVRVAGVGPARQAVALDEVEVAWLPRNTPGAL